jgi:hypothetical protein
VRQRSATAAPAAPATNAPVQSTSTFSARRAQEVRRRRQVTSGGAGQAARSPTPRTMPPAAAFALPTPPPCRSNAARSGLVRRGSCCPRGPRTPATRARRAPTECCAASAAERPRPPAPRPPQLPRPTPVPDEVILLLSGGAVGATVGLSVTAFKLSIGLLREFLYGDYVAGPLFDTVGSANLVIIPAMGGIAVAALRAATGPFVGGLSDCIADPAGKVSLPRALQKTLAAVLTLGAGLSLGPEQPCVDIGAVAGQRLAQALRLGGARRELLLACGAAAGLAAGFNAPIAGVFFALERLTFGNRVGRGGVDAAVVLLSASISALVAQAGLGSTPAFEPPLYEMLNPLAEIPMWLVLGLLSGGASVAFRRLLVAVNDFFNASGAMASVPAHVKPLIGASFCGLTALHFPQVLFFGYGTCASAAAVGSAGAPAFTGRHSSHSRRALCVPAPAARHARGAQTLCRRSWPTMGTFRCRCCSPCSSSSRCARRCASALAWSEARWRRRCSWVQSWAPRSRS